MDINDLRQSISALSPEKRALLERRLMEMDLRAPGEPAILRRDRAALDAIVARHEALRTTVVVRGEEPGQVVADRWAVALPLLDLCVVPATEREAELARALRTEARRPFNLATDLMLRALLVRLGEREHVLLLTVARPDKSGF